MTPAQVETIYEALAQQIDAVGPRQAPLYLAKLALLLAERLGEPQLALDAIASAARHLDPVAD